MLQLGASHAERQLQASRLEAAQAEARACRRELQQALEARGAALALAGRRQQQLEEQELQRRLDAAAARQRLERAEEELGGARAERDSTRAEAQAAAAAAAEARQRLLLLLEQGRARAAAGPAVLAPPERPSERSGCAPRRPEEQPAGAQQPWDAAGAPAGTGWQQEQPGDPAAGTLAARQQLQQLQLQHAAAQAQLAAREQQLKQLASVSTELMQNVRELGTELEATRGQLQQAEEELEGAREAQLARYKRSAVEAAAACAAAAVQGGEPAGAPPPQWQ
jgi:hypothetical protein